MKENLKKQTLIFLLLLLMWTTVFFTLILLVIDIHWSIKVVAPIASVVFTFYLFVNIKKLNKQLIYIEKESKKVIDAQVVETNHKVLCPKCLHPYDGEFCLICGYTKEENKA